MEKKELNKLFEYCKKVGVNDRFYKQCADKVIASGNALYNLKFVKEIAGADMKAHGQAVIESKCPEYNYYFAYMIKDIPGADIEGHRKVVLASRDSYYIQQFEKRVRPEPNKKIKNLEEPKEMYPHTKKLRELVLERNEVKKIVLKPEEGYSKKEGEYLKAEGKSN